MKIDVKGLCKTAVIIVAAAMATIIIMQTYYNRSNDFERKIVGIHIKGEVKAPGYYELEYGSRIKDAVIAAGSETQNADFTDVNLALILADGDEIVIPACGEKEKGNNTGLININTADMYKLCKLDGIGEKLAASIISYRSEKGKFKSINDLKKVEGIGNSKFNKIKDKIEV